MGGALRQLVYSKIRAGAGLSNVVCVVTGGGSLGRRLDDWYEVLGMEVRPRCAVHCASLSPTLSHQLLCMRHTGPLVSQVLNGWGLTETSPVVAARRLGNNVRGTVGVPLPATQVRLRPASR